MLESNPLKSRILVGRLAVAARALMPDGSRARHARIRTCRMTRIWYEHGDLQRTAPTAQWKRRRILTTQRSEVRFPQGGLGLSSITSLWRALHPAIKGLQPPEHMQGNPSGLRKTHPSQKKLGTCRNAYMRTLWYRHTGVYTLFVWVHMHTHGCATMTGNC